MPRITVTADPVSSPSKDAPVLLSETVRSVHLSTDHAAAQLIERLAWAIRDAEDAEDADGLGLQAPKTCRSDAARAAARSDISLEFA
jgi:hypothetical protein